MLDQINERKYISDISEDLDGQEIVVGGWIHEKRKLGGIMFVLLRDKTGMLQLAVPKKAVTPELFSQLSGMARESVVLVKGNVAKNNQAPGNVEILPNAVHVLNEAKTPLPLDVTDKVKADLDTRLDNRFLDLRKPLVKNLFLLRSSVLNGIRNYCEGKGFIEVHTPKVVAAGAEGGSTLFPIAYYDKEAYLAQSPQLYKQMLMATGFDRILEIAPAYRAEKSDTVRHLSEFISIDMEVAFIKTEDDVMRVLEESVVEGLKYAQNQFGEMLKAQGIEIKIPPLPFPRVTYTEAVDMVNKNGKSLEWGEDLDTESEKLLGKIMMDRGHEFYFITEYPSKMKPFYIMEYGDRPEVCRAFDLDYKGLEITSGGQREHREEHLVRRMKEQALNPEEFTFYLDAFRFGMPPHGGFGLGLERLVQRVFDVPNVRELVLFPRDRKRLVP